MGYVIEQSEIFKKQRPHSSALIGAKNHATRTMKQRSQEKLRRMRPSLRATFNQNTTIDSVGAVSLKSKKSRIDPYSQMK